MFEEKRSANVWNVALIAVLVFVAVISIAGVLEPAQVSAVSAKL